MILAYKFRITYVLFFVSFWVVAVIYEIVTDAQFWSGVYMFLLYLLIIVYLSYNFISLVYNMRMFHNYEYEVHKVSLIAYFTGSFTLQLLGAYTVYRLCQLDKGPHPSTPNFELNA